MSFSAPSFNTPAGLWFPPNTPASAGPDYTTNIQMYINPKLTFEQFDPYGLKIYVAQFIRMSKADYLALGAMVVGCIWGLTDSAGAQWFYRVMFWDTAHLNFVNEYIEMYVAQCSSNGTIPDPLR